ncbi:MAG: sulfotransferase [Acidimicrobiia bacterium]|nr:sulfotransferase [Acidimicrobiia bacterium]
MSAERPADVRIDDLLDPVFPPGVDEALSARDAEAEAIEWSVDAVRRDAREASGLDDFGDGLIDEPLALLVQIGRHNERCRGAGLVTFYETLVANAVQRLLIVDYIKRYPEVGDIEISRPIVIAGQARTGTTHLHNLLAADPALRSLQYWESLEPVPPLAEQGADRAGGADPRYRRVEEALAGLNYALPHFKRMHDMYTAHVHEEVQLQMPAFGGMLWETILHDERFRDWYLATDQTPWYEWMRTVLKVCTHVGGGRWVLKSPQHVEQLGPLMAAFPDATVLCTHRDPVAVTKSIATMLAYTARTSARPECLIDVAHYWIDRVERMFRAYAAGRDLVPSEQSMDVHFNEFMQDDVAMVARVYGLAGRPFTPEVRGAMDAFMDAHPRGKHGRVLYDLAAVGRDPGERRAALQFYVDRFGVATE